MSLIDLRYEAKGAVARITLDRPGARNAYSNDMITSFEQALDRAAADPEVRVVILTGAGNTFSAGGDLKAMQTKSGMFAGSPLELRRRYIEGIQRVPRRLARFDKPVIAAINGPAIGAGLDLACMCDLRVATKNAKFGSTFVKLGLVPGDGGSLFLSRVVGPARALELILTGRTVDADEALTIGLVNRVVGQADLDSAVETLAQELAANSPQAVRLAKTLFYQSLPFDLDAALNLAATYQSMVQNAEDHQEALQALAAGRPPSFEN